MPVRAMPDSTHARVQGEPPTSLPPLVSRKSEPLQAAYVSARIARLPSLLRVTHLVDETGLSRPTIMRMLDSGEIKSVRPSPGTRAVPSEWFAEWVEHLKAEALGVAR